MLRNWIVMILFLLLIGFALWHTLYLDDSSQSLSQIAEDLNEAAKTENINSAKEHAERLLSSWHEVRTIWAAIIESRDIEPINETVLAAYSNAQLGDMDELRIQTDLLIDQLQFIEEMSDVTAENIF